MDIFQYNILNGHLLNMFIYAGIQEAHYVSGGDAI